MGRSAAAAASAFAFAFASALDLCAPEVDRAGFFTVTGFFFPVAAAAAFFVVFRAGALVEEALFFVEAFRFAVEVFFFAAPCVVEDALREAVLRFPASGWLDAAALLATVFLADVFFRTVVFFAALLLTVFLRVDFLAAAEDRVLLVFFFEAALEAAAFFFVVVPLEARLALEDLDRDDADEEVCAFFLATRDSLPPRGSGSFAAARPTPLRPLLRRENLHRVADSTNRPAASQRSAEVWRWGLAERAEATGPGVSTFAELGCAAVRPGCPASAVPAAISASRCSRTTPIRRQRS